MSQPKEIFMVRDHLKDIPQYSLPEGYSLRNYCKGDEEKWFEIYKAADQYNKIYSEMFKEYFGADENKLSQRQFYLSYNDRVIGTASSWYNANYHGENIGRIHWVALHPDHQGQGLSKPLLSSVITRILKLGHEKCYLRTYDVRLRAISLYLSFGLRPDIHSEKDRCLWQGIAERFRELRLEDESVSVLNYLD